MGKIHMGRVLLGGLLAGVVLFFTEFVLQGVLLKGQWDAAMTALGRDPAAMKNSSAMMTYAVWSLIIGIVSVWFYAAARPRFGVGPLPNSRSVEKIRGGGSRPRWCTDD